MYCMAPDLKNTHFTYVLLFWCYILFCVSLFHVLLACYKYRLFIPGVWCEEISRLMFCSLFHVLLKYLLFNSVWQSVSEVTHLWWECTSHGITISKNVSIILQNQVHTPRDRLGYISLYNIYYTEIMCDMNALRNHTLYCICIYSI